MSFHMTQLLGRRFYIATQTPEELSEIIRLLDQRNLRISTENETMILIVFKSHIPTSALDAEYKDIHRKIRGPSVVWSHFINTIEMDDF